MSETLGFIGTGNLGGAFVVGLLKAGYDVAIFDSDTKGDGSAQRKGRTAARLGTRGRR